MNPQDTEDRPVQTPADLELRAMLAQADPSAGGPLDPPEHLLDRIRSEIAEQPVITARPRGSFLSRHWQGAIMAAAAVLSLALASATILPGLAGGGSDSASDSVSQSAAAPEGSGMADSAAAGAQMDMALTDGAARSAADSGTAAAPAADETKNTLVRSASLLVGAEDLRAARDSFVAGVLADGGRIISETVVTDGSTASGMAGADVGARDMGMSYPWYPTGPGIWVTVEVPADEYDKTVEAARQLGDVVQLQQSSYDVGQQVTDVDARIQVLEASLERLAALMEQAEGVSEVIKVESAIAERQAELDSLRAQQRDLTNQTAMSQVSLTLMTPDDAQQSVDPTPQQSWWESFLDGLSDLWAWLGRALLIVTPLLLGAGIIWWVRRRRGRRSVVAVPASGAATGAAPGAPADVAPGAAAARPAAPPTQ